MPAKANENNGQLQPNALRLRRGEWSLQTDDLLMNRS